MKIAVISVHACVEICTLVCKERIFKLGTLTSTPNIAVTPAFSKSSVERYLTAKNLAVILTENTHIDSNHCFTAPLLCFMQCGEVPDSQKPCSGVQAKGAARPSRTR